MAWRRAADVGELVEELAAEQADRTSSSAKNGSCFDELLTDAFDTANDWDETGLLAELAEDIARAAGR